jgi:hypothetical protein
LSRGRRAGGERGEVAGGDRVDEVHGTIHCHEVFRGNDDSSGSAVSPLGLPLADAKAVLAIGSRLTPRFWGRTVKQQIVITR